MFVLNIQDDDDIITWSLMKPDIFAVVMDYFAVNETVAVIEEPVDHNTGIYFECHMLWFISLDQVNVAYVMLCKDTFS